MTFLNPSDIHWLLCIIQKNIIDIFELKIKIGFLQKNNFVMKNDSLDQNFSNILKENFQFNEFYNSNLF